MQNLCMRFAGPALLMLGGIAYQLPGSINSEAAPMSLLQEPAAQGMSWPCNVFFWWGMGLLPVRIPFFWARGRHPTWWAKCHCAVLFYGCSQVGALSRQLGTVLSTRVLCSAQTRPVLTTNPNQSDCPGVRVCYMRTWCSMHIMVH
jgi:hypothetical protein